MDSSPGSVQSHLANTTPPTADPNPRSPLIRVEPPKSAQAMVATIPNSERRYLAEHTMALLDTPAVDAPDTKEVTAARISGS